MGTKLNPGRFDCYAAALLDEPYFLVLARDPDAPTLTRQWGAMRHARIKSGERSAEDMQMIHEADHCAREMEIWREANVNVTIPRLLLGEPVDPFVGSRWQHETPPQVASFAQMADMQRTITGQAEELETLRSQDTVSRREIARLQGLLEQEQSRVDALQMETVSEGDAVQLLRKLAVGLRQVAGDLMADTMDAMVNDTKADRLNGYAAECDAAVAVMPDLAEPPEINDHRFGHLEKHGDYAYARGLTVAPQHLPKALHQMETDYGWRLLAIFGETTCEKIGFIFKRVQTAEDQLREAMTRSIASNLGRTIGEIEIPEELRGKAGTFHTGGFVTPADKPFRAIALGGNEHIISKDDPRAGPFFRSEWGADPKDPTYAAEANLVQEFGHALFAKLRAAHEKRGSRDWIRDNWQGDLRFHLLAHIDKGDPLDVAAYAAFAWHHGWSLKPQPGERKHGALTWVDVRDMCRDLTLFDGKRFQAVLDFLPVENTMELEQRPDLWDQTFAICAFILRSRFPTLAHALLNHPDVQRQTCEGLER